MTTATETDPNAPVDELTEEQAQQACSEGFNSVDPLVSPDAEPAAPPTEPEPATPPPTPPAAPPPAPPETPPAEVPPAEPAPAATPPATPEPTTPPAPTLESLQEEIRRQGVVIEEMEQQNRHKFKRLDGTTGGQKSALQAINQKLKTAVGARVEITEADVPELLHEFPEFGRSVLAGLKRVEARRFGTPDASAAPPPAPAAPAATVPPMPPTDNLPAPDPVSTPNPAAPPITDPLTAPPPDPEQAMARRDMDLVRPGWQNIVYTDEFQQWLDAHGPNYAIAIRDSKDPFRLKAEIERFTEAQNAAPPTTPPPDTPPATPEELAERRFRGQVQPSTMPSRVPLPSQKTDAEYVSEGFNAVKAARGEA